jgi:hypothetical protein
MKKSHTRGKKALAKNKKKRKGQKTICPHSRIPKTKKRQTKKKNGTSLPHLEPPKHSEPSSLSLLKPKQAYHNPSFIDGHFHHQNSPASHKSGITNHQLTFPIISHPANNLRFFYRCQSPSPYQHPDQPLFAPIATHHLTTANHKSASPTDALTLLLHPKSPPTTSISLQQCNAQQLYVRCEPP